jgi:hypothetical protein
MVVKNNVPYCDYCRRELEAKTEQECLDDIIPHGWTNWRDAQVHCCYACSDGIWKPPCDECETHPCEKGRDCWASPPLHLLPYETYFANALGEDYMPTIDLDEDDPDYGESVPEDEEERELDLQIRRRQIMKLAGQHPHQTHLTVQNETEKVET